MVRIFSHKTSFDSRVLTTFIYELHIVLEAVIFSESPASLFSINPPVPDNRTVSVQYSPIAPWTTWGRRRVTVFRWYPVLPSAATAVYGSALWCFAVKTSYRLPCRIACAVVFVRKCCRIKNVVVDNKIKKKKQHGRQYSFRNASPRR